MEGLFEETEIKHDKPFKKLGVALIGVFGAAAVGICAIAIPFVSPALRKICVPYVPATATQVENVIKCLAGRKGTVIDLGSGDGRLVVAAAKQLGLKSEGVELNPWLIAYSRMLSWKSRTNHLTKFTRRNLWTVNLSCYDNIIIFGTQELMLKLDEKLHEDHFTGLLLACRFPLVKRNPAWTVGKGIDTVWVYNWDKLKPTQKSSMRY
ncbi:hypothetical protein CHUAL_000754 [Chamberlinius hualienensis]